MMRAQPLETLGSHLGHKRRILQITRVDNGTLEQLRVKVHWGCLAL
jgi:hypothetical protein